jgi:hypothetical protein
MDETRESSGGTRRGTRCLINARSLRKGPDFQSIRVRAGPPLSQIAGFGFPISRAWIPSKPLPRASQGTSGDVSLEN